jgi:hypothetical protein
MLVHPACKDAVVRVQLEGCSWKGPGHVIHPRSIDYRVWPGRRVNLYTRVR